MFRHLFLLSLLLTLVFIISGTARCEIFTESGLMDIPTGEVLEHGIFGAGVSAFFQSSSDFQRDAAAFRLNIGMFDRTEFGLSNLLLQDESYSRYAFAHIKAQLLSESELIPNVSIGVENLGDRISDEWHTYQSKSVYLVVSKTFNLPLIHLISGHFGIGNNRFAAADQPVGFFAGVSTEVSPAFARGDIGFNLEYDGTGLNAGIRHSVNSGLQIALGVETLNKPEEMRYILSISWSNAKMLEQIDGTKRLAKQAAKLASEAKNQPEKREE